MTAEPPCTCKWAKPRRHGVILPGTKGHKYATYLDFIEDDTEFDPACSYHGENGTMVSRVRVRDGMVVTTFHNR
jgi:hypothetical protein